MYSPHSTLISYKPQLLELDHEPSPPIYNLKIIFSLNNLFTTFVYPTRELAIKLCIVVKWQRAELFHFSWPEKWLCMYLTKKNGKLATKENVMLGRIHMYLYIRGEVSGLRSKKKSLVHLCHLQSNWFLQRDKFIILYTIFSAQPCVSVPCPMLHTYNIL
jgi:hypothetical protein